MYLLSQPCTYNHSEGINGSGYTSGTNTKNTMLSNLRTKKTSGMLGRDVRIAQFRHSRGTKTSSASELLHNRHIYVYAKSQQPKRAIYLRS